MQPGPAALFILNSAVYLGLLVFVGRSCAEEQLKVHKLNRAWFLEELCFSVPVFTYCLNSNRVISKTITVTDKKVSRRETGHVLWKNFEENIIDVARQKERGQLHFTGSIKPGKRTHLQYILGVTQPFQEFRNTIVFPIICDMTRRPAFFVVKQLPRD